MGHKKFLLLVLIVIAFSLIILHYFELVCMRYYQAASVSTLAVINLDLYICSLSSNEEVLVNSYFTWNQGACHTNCFVDVEQYICLWVSDDWSHWRIEDALSSTYLAFTILIIKHVDIHRNDLDFEEVLDFGPIRSISVSGLHALRQIRWQHKREWIASFTHR